jgi:hypothetical protein
MSQNKTAVSQNSIDYLIFVMKKRYGFFSLGTKTLNDIDHIPAR